MFIASKFYCDCFVIIICWRWSWSFGNGSVFAKTVDDDLFFVFFRMPYCPLVVSYFVVPLLCVDFLLSDYLSVSKKIQSSSTLFLFHIMLCYLVKGPCNIIPWRVSWNNICLSHFSKYSIAHWWIKEDMFWNSNNKNELNGIYCGRCWCELNFLFFFTVVIVYP